MRFVRVRTRLGLACLVGALLAPIATSGVAAAVAPAGDTVTIDNTLPRWLSQAQPVLTTARMSTPPMAVQVYLQPRGGLAALQNDVAAVSDPASPRFGQWLDTAQFVSTYAPTQATVDSVTGYLTGKGLSVTAVDSKHRFVSVTGTRGQLGDAFGVTLNTYRHDGQTVVAPNAAVSLPRAIGATVLTVTGLDTTVSAVKTTQAFEVNPPDGRVDATPCSTYFGALPALRRDDTDEALPKFQGKQLSFSPCGYVGSQFRSAYTGNTRFTGTGVTVAVVGAYRWQYWSSDAKKYAAKHGDTAYATGQLSEKLPSAYTNEEYCAPETWANEQMLDTEAVHAMAGAAKIRYYSAASCFLTDLAVALRSVVDENRAKVVTNSWSAFESTVSDSEVAMYQQILLQGAMQGISFIWSSGDGGDEEMRTGFKQVDYPASDPYATAVGGTSTAIDKSGKITATTGWGSVEYGLSSSGYSWVEQGFVFGSGGGYSDRFARPAYQKKAIPGSAPAGRGVPDISMNADPTTGMLVGQTQTFYDGIRYGEYRTGGTSLSAPLFAGLVALGVQAAGGKGFGMLNPRLYSMPSLVTDVTPTTAQVGTVRVDFENGVDPSDGMSYKVSTFDRDSSLRTTTGWDPVTGLGTPNVAMIAAVSDSLGPAVRPKVPRVS